MVKNILIIGGGFAGLNAAKRLAGDPRVKVTLVDQRNHHLFQPLLYQVATAGLNPADIAVPIRAQFSRDENIAVHLGRVDEVNLREKWISGQGDLRISYDYLIIACGAQHSYFGRPEWEEFAPGLKTLEQATEIRRRILSAFERAENEADPAVQRALLTFVVVGGGPTGVELAGAIADISRKVLVRDFRRINPASARVILVEAGKRVLASFDEELSARAGHDLERLGVELRTGVRVTEIDANGVSIGAERIEARSVFWAAGVQAASISRQLGVELDPAGRVRVSADLSVPGHPDAFVVGDLAHIAWTADRMVPGMAPAAIQMGRLAAENILLSIAGKSRRPFRYFDKGQMATIGKNKAILEAGQLKFAGYFAWLAWLLIHILYLIGFRNRVAVLFGWMWSYVFSKQGARLITNRDWKLDTNRSTRS